jgi:hypothetical protein
MEGAAMKASSESTAFCAELGMAVKPSNTSLLRKSLRGDDE